MLDGALNVTAKFVLWLTTRSQLRWLLLIVVYSALYYSVTRISVPSEAASAAVDGSSSSAQTSLSLLMASSSSSVALAAMSSSSSSSFSSPTTSLVASGGGHQQLIAPNRTPANAHQHQQLKALYPIGVISLPEGVDAWTNSYMLRSDGVKATITLETIKNYETTEQRPAPHKLSSDEITHKYCSSSNSRTTAHEGQCHRYLAHVPDRGARVGHFLFHTEFHFHAAYKFNLTVLYHPIIPNQKERYLFEGLFGYGVDEPYRYREACVEGRVGFECTSLLPCLRTKHFKDMDISSPQALDEQMKREADECNVVYTGIDDIKSMIGSYDDIEQDLRRKYANARVMMPIKSLFEPAFINVAIHIRRGDVSETANEYRFTSNTVYLKMMETMRHAIADISATPVKFHVFSEGQKDKDFAEFAGFDDIEYHLSDSLVSAVHHLIIADVLVISRSGFSALCGRLRHPDRLTLYAEGFPLSHARKSWPWVSFNNDSGSFNIRFFQDKLHVSLRVPPDFP